MFYLIGNNALSEFRKLKLLKILKQISKNIIDVETNYIYLIDEALKLKESAIMQLKQILNCDKTKNNFKNFIDNNLFYKNNSGVITSFVVIPRIGTISPWSSKVSDIFFHCGIRDIIRIERGVVYNLIAQKDLDKSEYLKITGILHDKMTQSMVTNIEDAFCLFRKNIEKKLNYIDIIKNGKNELEKANQKLGLALSSAEVDYLFAEFIKLERNPTDAELFMYSQINSEHCRHKVFNAGWEINGKKIENSLFQMIKNTKKKNSIGIFTNYDDNGAVIESYGYNHENNEKLVIKVETHNHPTAISPYSGAATGVGGEIRDEAATGTGARSIAGLSGFCVSNLKIPGFIRPWEQYELFEEYAPPERITSALNIMLEAPIGAASFSNEFGRPNLSGFFRSFEARYNQNNIVHGYHKPIMLAGGIGKIYKDNICKRELKAGDKIILLGGPGYLIGLGGGALSSVDSNDNNRDLDFASVQRDNAEMQRRAQEVINQCYSLKSENPIVSIHDLGAGGLANALSELLHSSNKGGDISLQEIPIAEKGMSPLEILCNESQERYILAIEEKNLELFSRFAVKENCPYAVIGTVNNSGILNIIDKEDKNNSISVPLNLFFDNNPRMHKKLTLEEKLDCESTLSSNFDLNNLFEINKIELKEAIYRVLSLPAVADKSFLINIADRSVGGLVARDQLVGPWQVPVADCSVTCNDFESFIGQAMSIGERPQLSLLNPVASVRMAVGEAITNIVASPIKNISDIKLSANWMVAANIEKESLNLFKAVSDLGLSFCPELGIAIPVGKDSTSMQTNWLDNNTNKTVISPLSCIITAFSPVSDVRKTLTPELDVEKPDTKLLFIDLADGKQRLGGSSFLQVYNELGDNPPSVDNPKIITGFFTFIQELNKNDKILSYHDRSDGGLIVTLLEMAFAANSGLNIDITALGDNIPNILFNEELGCVIQIATQDLDYVKDLGKKYCLPIYEISTINNSKASDDSSNKKINIFHNKILVFSDCKVNLHQQWSKVSFNLQSLRDNPHTSQQEYDLKADTEYKGLKSYSIPNNFPKTKFALKLNNNLKVAILREQGTNGHVEMAKAFNQAGFEVHDIHTNELLHGNKSLKDFIGLAVCGGFSYGDVLGSGSGWANKILFNSKLKDMFGEFFANTNKFALGVCNGCQTLSLLKEIIPGSDLWPGFTVNNSEQFESRYCLVKINKTKSILFNDMQEAILPIVVAHKEGKTLFNTGLNLTKVLEQDLVTMQYVNSNGNPTVKFPLNPNGSDFGITGLTNSDGRINIMMPHPERVFRTIQNSWHPKEWENFSSWFEMFVNARKFCD